jgi:urea transport system substrate-binding protein
VPGSQFRIFWEAEAPERPDPYLSDLDLASFAKPDINADTAVKRATHLRVVK